MFTTVTLIGWLRAALEWARVRLNASPFAAQTSFMQALDPCRIPAPAPIPTPRRPRVMRVMAGAALAALLLAPGASKAQAAVFDATADGRLVDVQVQVDGRGTSPLYVAPGRFDRQYFQAFEGRNYSLVLRNNTGERVGVLVTVDGLNVISGNRSNLSRTESMYVLDPWESATIRGWRTSLNNVRRFVFVDEEHSYAERSGQANGDLGWIRVLAFNEQRPWWEPRAHVRDRDEERGGPEPLDGGAPELQRQPPTAKGQAAPREGVQSAPSPSRNFADGQDSNPGTGWGEHRYDPVNRTEFTAAAYPMDRITLRYEYASGLRALGIRIGGRERLWNRERGQLGFAQPPRW
jgi:hypothetical protein